MIATNEFGTTEHGELVTYVDSHPPKIGYIWLESSANPAQFKLRWENTEGADFVGVAFMDESTPPVETYLDSMLLDDNTNRSNEMNLLHSQLSGDGYIKVTFENNYGREHVLLRVSQSCPRLRTVFRNLIRLYPLVYQLVLPLRSFHRLRFFGLPTASLLVPYNYVANDVPDTMVKVENNNEFALKVYASIAGIPEKVATYGDVAELAGYPRHARHVGKLLSQLPEGSKSPGTGWLMPKERYL